MKEPGKRHLKAEENGGVEESRDMKAGFFRPSATLRLFIYFGKGINGTLPERPHGATFLHRPLGAVLLRDLCQFHSELSRKVEGRAL